MHAELKKILDIADRYGIETVGYKNMREHIRVEVYDGCGYGFPVEGAPGLHASIYFDEEKYRILYDSHAECDSVIEYLFHEICHALSGPRGFDDEGELMVLQYGFIKHVLDGKAQSICRRSFADYGLDWEWEGGIFSEVGTGDDFTDSEEWRALADQAYIDDLVDDDGKPNESIKPFHLWSSKFKKLSDDPVTGWYKIK